MKLTIKPLLSALMLSLLFAPAGAEISFLSPDINAGNDVLFSVKADIPGSESYQTLFKNSLETGKLEQLTFYPEAMESLSGGTLLQIRNRFGIGRFNTLTDGFSWVKDNKPFYEGGPVGLGMLQELSTSPDGRFLVSIEPVTPARGRLGLYDTVKDMRYTRLTAAQFRFLGRLILPF